MIPVEEVNKYIDLVCKYVFKKGISKDTKCYVRTHCDGYCLKHFKLMQKSINKVKKEKCSYMTINGICKRSCESDKSTCKYHKQGDFKIVQNENDKKKLKKKLKRMKYKERKKSKISKEIKIEYIDKSVDMFGFPKSNKRKSPFPNEELIIDNKTYKNIYYLWKPVQKQVHLYCIDITSNKEEIIICSIDKFQEMLLRIYTKETVDNYFGW